MLGTLGYDVAQLKPDPRWHGRFHLGTTHAEPLAAVPLRAIYLLDWGETAIVPMRGLNGLRELVVAGTYRPDLVARTEQAARHWQRCLDLSARVPLYRFCRPMDAAQMGLAHERLLDHLAGNMKPLESSLETGGHCGNDC
jgi:hypothetical protein